MLHRIVLLCILFFVCNTYITAQSFCYTKYTTHEGLPIDNVYAAAQDPDGFVWFATDFGISKFDGYRFVNYDKSHGISNTAVIDITYAGGDSLIFCSYPSTLQSIHTDGRITTLSAIYGITIQQVIKHENSFIFFQRYNSKFGIYKNGGTSIINADSLLKETGIEINSVFSLNEKGLAVCTNKGLFIVNGPQVSKYINTPVHFGIYTTKKEIIATGEGNIYQSQNLQAFQKFAVSLPDKSPILNMAEEPDGTLWLRGITKGIYRVQNGQLSEASGLLGIKDQNVNEFFVDKGGNMFFCTATSGVLLKRFGSVTSYKIEDGLVNNKVNKLYKQNNSLFIGTENGLCIKEGNSIKSLPLPNASATGLHYVFNLFNAGNKPGICITSAFNYTTGAQKYVQNAVVGNYAVTAVNGFAAYANEGEGNYFFLSGPSINEIKNNTVTTSVSLLGYNVRRFFCVHKQAGKYWIGFNKGILVWDGKQIEKIDSLAGKPLGQVFKILQDKTGKLWIATDNGLVTLHNNKAERLATGNNNAGNYCTDITFDDEANIWGTTWNGIFTVKGTEIKNFSTGYGLSSKTCNAILYDSSTKKLYIGTNNGLNEIAKNDLLKQVVTVKVFISCTQGDTIAIKPGTTLNSSQNSLSFYFNTPYFKGSNDIEYQYKVDNGSWQSTKTPSVLLSEIIAGSHTLYARAVENNTIITTTNGQFTFTIKQKFYKTWWFWVLAALLFQLIIFRIINHYNKKAKERKLAAARQQTELASLKQQAFTSLMNPHFIFNALNSIQFYINKQDRQTANKYLSDFAMLIRRSFDSSQKPYVLLDEELETIKLYLQLEKMRFTDAFDYSITTNDAVEEDDWLLPGMVLQPFLENAILHGLSPLGSNGHLDITIKGENNTLYITIADNGIGMEKSKQLRIDKKHNSRGMQLIKERLEILSKQSLRPLTLTISPLYPGAANPGTKVELVIPQEVYENGYGKK